MQITRVFNEIRDRCIMNVCVRGNISIRIWKFFVVGYKLIEHTLYSFIIHGKTAQVDLMYMSIPKHGNNNIVKSITLV